jgi:hypothetical protein
VQLVTIVSLKRARDKSQKERLAPVRSAPSRMAPERSARFRLACCRVAPPEVSIGPVGTLWRWSSGPLQVGATEVNRSTDIPDQLSPDETPGVVTEGLTGQTRLIVDSETGLAEILAVQVDGHVRGWPDAKRSSSGRHQGGFSAAICYPWARLLVATADPTGDSSCRPGLVSGDSDEAVK